MMELIGKESMNWFDQKEQRNVSGIKLHVLANDLRVEGTAALQHFFETNHPLFKKVQALEFGKIDVDFNIKGVMQDIYNVK